MFAFGGDMRYGGGMLTLQELAQAALEWLAREEIERQMVKSDQDESPSATPSPDGHCDQSEPDGLTAAPLPMPHPQTSQPD